MSLHLPGHSPVAVVQAVRDERGRPGAPPPQNASAAFVDEAAAFHGAAIEKAEGGQLLEALALLDRALALNSQFALGHLHRGEILQALGRRRDAVVAFEGALELHPDWPPAQERLGRAWLELGEARAAARVLEPLGFSSDPSVLLLVARAHVEAGSLRVARAVLERARDLAPTDPVVAFELGNALFSEGRPRAALDAYGTAVAGAPQWALAWTNRGNALMEIGDHEAAESSYRSSLAFDPSMVQTHFNLGVLLQEQRRFPDAIERYEWVQAADSALRLKARFNEAVCHLSLGDYARGWEAYEVRVQAKGAALPARSVAPWWDGEPLANQTILLHAEQGLGDTLQFCRYAQVLAAEAAKVILSAPAPLVRLLKTLKDTKPGAPIEVVEMGMVPEAIDRQAMLMSVPRARPTPSEQLGRSVPYLYADAAATTRWRQWLGPSQNLRVGLVWSGSERTGQTRGPEWNRRRSIPLGHLAPLLLVPGIDWISLQVGPAEAELAQFIEHQRALGPRPPAIRDAAPLLRDFADTAALVMGLDWVVTCDTAVAHLAGALGAETWVLNCWNRCWRWLDARTDSPWYPTVRLFNQSRPDDWNDVVTELIAATQSRVTARR